MNKYICPVCNCEMPYPPDDFHICPSCNTEFGYDDAGKTTEELRKNWFEKRKNVPTEN